MMKSAITAVAALSMVTAYAQSDSPLWLRNTAISPDGTQVAFTYHGDIYAVPVNGGRAVQLTTNSAFDTAPVWSPDGRYIAFASDREGSMDIYVMDAKGGTPWRVTTHSGTESPRTWLNDTTILFAANVMPLKDAAQPGIMQQVYSVNYKGGRPAIFASVPMGAISVNKDGRILYQDKKGYEDGLRKHERSSGTSDIWLIEDDKYSKLTDFNGHDLSPIWASDGKSFYYVSEQDGILNVYKRGLDGKETQITKMERHPVRSLSAANDGTLAFSWDGEIYTVRPGGSPQKVSVEIVGDDYDSDVLKGYRSYGATNMAVSPSGEEVAFVLRGDVYVTSVKYETTKRITNTDGQERNISFSPDGRKLVYDSERDGIWQLYVSEIKNDDDKLFTYATEIEEKPLYKSNEPAQQPAFSPDGKKVAFLEDRTAVKVIDLDTKEVTTALDGKYNYSYSDGDVTFEWSPDSQWFLTSYIGIGGWNNSDIALVKADGSEVINLTESGYSDSRPRWALDGKALTYTSGRYGYRSHGSWGEEDDVIIMVLDPEAWEDFNLTEEEVALKDKATDKSKKDEDKADNKDKKDKKNKKGKKDDKEVKEDNGAKPLKFDLDNRNYRTRRLTGNSSHMADHWLSKKGDKLYYIARATEGGTDLMEVDLKKGGTKVLVKGISYSGIEPDKEGENIYLLSGSGMQKVTLSNGERKNIDFQAQYSRHPSAERAYIFDHAVRQVKDKFYDENIHGVDWDGYAADYRKFLPYINNNDDFATVLSELLGELNASHTGGRYYGHGASMSTASLGAFFDETYDGDGLKVVEVLPRGPLSINSADIVPGDIILTINGDTIKAGADYYPLLEGKSNKKVALGVVKADGKTKRVEVRPRGGVSDLLYQRWVEHNEHVVDSVSGGRVGYVHVEGMNSESFRRVYSKLLGKYRNCDAVVVDTRYNGGGWLHNDIALLLSGKEYVRYSPQGHYIGSDPFSQWTKPSVMLVNEANYSDAHGTPYVYQTLGIGDIVGSPVPGTMTAVWWETQIDPSIVFGIPQVTSLDRNGKPLENQQLNPDVLIYNNPLDEQRGIDAQLIGATKAVMKKIK